MGKIADIRNVFELIAKTHTAIGHAPEANPSVDRFYGYNMDESNTGDRETLSFPRLGLAMKNQSGLTGRYQQLTGSIRDTTFIEVILIDKAATNDYAGEEGCYDRMKIVMDDIVNWINHAVTTDVKFKYKALAYINPDQISYSRVKSVTLDNAFGWKMTFASIDEMYYSNANPLSALDTL